IFSTSAVSLSTLSASASMDMMRLGSGSPAGVVLAGMELFLSAVQFPVPLIDQRGELGPVRLGRAPVGLPGVLHVPAGLHRIRPVRERVALPCEFGAFLLAVLSHCPTVVWLGLATAPVEK